MGDTLAGKCLAAEQLAESWRTSPILVGQIAGIANSRLEHNRDNHEFVPPPAHNFCLDHP